MNKKLEFNSFSEAINKWLNFKEIKEITRRETKELREKISQELIDALYDWVNIKKWDELDYLKALTSVWNKIQWTDKEASDLIYPWDVIKLVINKQTWKKEFFKNWKNIWYVVSWFEKSKEINVEENKDRSQKSAIQKPEPTKPIPQSQNTDSPSISNEETPPTNSDDNSIFFQEEDIATDFDEENVLDTDVSYVFNAWRNSLIWDNGETVNIETHISKETVDKYINSNFKLWVLIQVIDIWINQANRETESLKWKESRDLYKSFNKNKEKISSILENYISDPAFYEDNYNKTVQELFQLIMEVEESSMIWIIWASDMKDVKNILLSNEVSNFNHKSKDNKKDKIIIDIYNLMRYKWISWNSKDIKEKVSLHLLEEKGFENIKEILNDQNIFNFIDESDNKGLLNYLREKGFDLLFDEITIREIIEEHTKMKGKIIKNDSIYREKYDELEAYAKNKWETLNISFNDFKRSINLESTSILLKHVLLRKKIDEMNNRWSEENSFTWLYANISGLWDGEKWILWDIVTIKDDNIDIALEIWLNLAITAATMWVWGVAIWVGRAAWQLALRSRTIANIATKAWASLWRSAPYLKFAWSSIVEWSLFYEWMTISQNLIYWNWNWNDNWNDSKEIIKSIWILGVFKAFRWISSAFKNSKLHDILPLKTLNDSKILNSILFSSWVMTEAAAMTGTAMFIENYMFDWDMEWTLEEYLQAVLLVWILKVSWSYMEKTFISKNWKGEILIKESSPNREIITEARKIEQARIQWKDWIPGWEYIKHSKRYEGLYKQLDKEGIIDLGQRNKRIKALDRKIAKERLSNKKNIRKAENEQAELLIWEKNYDVSLSNELNNLKTWGTITLDNGRTIKKQGKNQFTINDWTIIHSKKDIIRSVPKEYKVLRMNEIWLSSLKNFNLGEKRKVWKYEIWKDEAWIFIKFKNKDWKSEIIRNEWRIKEIISSETNIRNFLNEKHLLENKLNKIPIKVQREIADWIFKQLSKTIKSSDKILSEIPLLKYLYGRWKWAWGKIFNNVKKPIDMIHDPYLAFKNNWLSEWVNKSLKVLAFGSPNVTIKEWVGRIIKMGLLPIWIEIGYNFIPWLERENHSFTINSSEFLEEYASFMYLWVFNTMLIGAYKIYSEIYSEEENNTNIE